MKIDITVIESEIAEMGVNILDVLQTINGLLPLGEFTVITGEKVGGIPTEWASGMVITSHKHAIEIRGEDDSIKSLALMRSSSDADLFELHDAYVKGVLLAKQSELGLVIWDPNELLAAITDVAADEKHYPGDFTAKLVHRRFVGQDAGGALHEVSELLLRLIAGGLNELEISTEMHGSRGFVDMVKGQVKNRLALGTDEELATFAQEWVLHNPLKPQDVLEVVRPHPDLGAFNVYQYWQGTDYLWSARHYIFLDKAIENDERQIQLLTDYVNRVHRQYLNFNFSGGSSIDGQPAPGWETLKKHWPRLILFERNKVMDEDTNPIIISYSSQSESAVKAICTWLDSQFAIFSSRILSGDIKVKCIPRDGKGRRY